MKLREYRSTDCENTINLFYNTVHFVNAIDYTEQQLNAWVGNDINFIEWDKRLLENYTVIAEKDSVIVGFGSIDNEGYFDLLYVHKYYQRNGIATLIADNIEKYISMKGVQIITSDVSITAKPFFESRDYIVLAEQAVERKNQHLTNYKMQKQISN